MKIQVIKVVIYLLPMMVSLALDTDSLGEKIIQELNGYNEVGTKDGMRLFPKEEADDYDAERGQKMDCYDCRILNDNEGYAGFLPPLSESRYGGIPPFITKRYDQKKQRRTNLFFRQMRNSYRQRDMNDLLTKLLEGVQEQQNY